MLCLLPLLFLVSVGKFFGLNCLSFVLCFECMKLLISGVSYYVLSQSKLLTTPTTTVACQYREEKYNWYRLGRLIATFGATVLQRERNEQKNWIENEWKKKWKKKLCLIRLLSLNTSFCWEFTLLCHSNDHVCKVFWSIYKAALRVTPIHHPFAWTNRHQSKTNDKTHRK